MEITRVKVRKYEGEKTKLKGFATVFIDDCFVISDIRILEGTDKMFIAMPSKKVADGKYIDIAHPINTETRAMFEEKILEEYNKLA